MKKTNKTSLNILKLLLALIFCWAFFSVIKGRLFAQSFDEPASEMPEVSRSEVTTMENPSLDALIDVQKAELATGVLNDDSSRSVGTWDSYMDEPGADGIAEDVTNGIRVEDIVEPPSSYRYAAFGKGDPFVPPMLTGYKESSTETPIVSVLQRYLVSSLRVVGLWEVASGAQKALIMTPKEEGIIATVGDFIGKQSGQILSMNDVSVTVREFVIAPDGTRQFEDIKMYLGNEHPEEVIDDDSSIDALPEETESNADDEGVGFVESSDAYQQRRNLMRAEMKKDNEVIKPFDAEAGVVKPAKQSAAKENAVEKVGIKGDESKFAAKLLEAKSSDLTDEEKKNLERIMEMEGGLGR